MTRLAAGGRAARPGLGDQSLPNRLWARAIGCPYPPPGILRQHAARVLAHLAAFTDDYPDAESENT